MSTMSTRPDWAPGRRARGERRGAMVQLVAIWESFCQLKPPVKNEP